MSEADTSDRGSIEWTEGCGWHWRYVPDSGEASEGYAQTRDDALRAIGTAAAPASLRPQEVRWLTARSRWGN
ncbi:hypothetical protein GCM10023175_72420 [Pseudonocardia xishanensis]|uniref:DUF1508 domain-containing protein n=1 Tax=Pseudonocardia xishanensis TaxID=630995 RepID=A0ABP8S5H3_9PSEU